jgi:hypothetical protein
LNETRKTAVVVFYSEGKQVAGFILTIIPMLVVHRGGTTL